MTAQEVRRSLTRSQEQHRLWVVSVAFRHGHHSAATFKVLPSREGSKTERAILRQAVLTLTQEVTSKPGVAGIIPLFFR